MSQGPEVYRQQVRIPPLSTSSSSSPGGSSSGISTVPVTRLTRHVPQLPAVQLVGIVTPASSAISTNDAFGSAGADPRIAEPRKNRTTGNSFDMEALNGPPNESSVRIAC